jgi:hypothetical protein
MPHVPKEKPKEKELDPPKKEEPRIPSPSEVEAATLDDLLSDHLGQRSLVMAIKDENTKEYIYKRVTFKKVDHNDWENLLTETEGQKLIDYYRKLLKLSSVEPDFSQIDYGKKKIDAGFILNYGRVIENYILEIRFL